MRPQTPRATVDLLAADRESGALARLCAAHGVDLLVLFGSARFEPETAGDVDVAYLFALGVHGDELGVVNALGDRYGDHLDIMALHRAGPVAAYAALGGGEVLAELTPQRFADRQMVAFGEYCDTQRFRDWELEMMAR